MRAFVALIPPAAVLAELDAAVAPLRTAHPVLRWTPGAQWHLTLAFLGEIDDRVLPELADRLERAGRRHAPMSLALGGGGRFGDRVLWTRVLTTPDGAPRVERESCVPTGRVVRSDSLCGCAAVGESCVSTGRVVRSDSLCGCAAVGESCVPTGHVVRSDRSPDVDRLRRLAASVTAAARRCGIAVDDRPYRPHLTLARGRDGTDLRPLVAALAEFVGSRWTADALHLVRSRLGAGPGGAALHEVVETWPLGR